MVLPESSLAIPAPDDTVINQASRNRVDGQEGHQHLPSDSDTTTPSERYRPDRSPEVSCQEAASPSPASCSSSAQSDENDESHGNEQDTETLPEPSISTETISNSSARHRSYRPWKLNWKWIAFLLLTETAIIATILALDVVSARNNGIASVLQPSAFSFSTLRIPSSWAYGLLWTTLPTFMLKLFEAMWGTVVSATAERQPYVDLCRPETAAQSAKLTIVLDYGSYPSWKGWFKAFRNRHGLVGSALLLNLITSLSLVPLTSHLFSTINSATSTLVQTSFTSSFNGSALTGSTTLRPAIDLANAIHAYNSTPPAWMTAEYAFLPFNVATGNSEGNMTLGNATAYSARLDCQTPTYSANLDNDMLTISATDHGCAISTYFTISNQTPSYSRSWVVPSCKGSEYGRIGIVTGYYSESSSIKLGSPSLISCIAGYYRSNGSLTQAFKLKSLPTFISFDPSDELEIRPIAYMTLEDTLHSYNTFDPASASSVDAFGAAVLSAARSRLPNNQFDTNVILNATVSLYATVFAVLAVNTLFQAVVETPPSMQATLSTEVTRLYVNRPVAWAIVGIMALILACTVALFVYARIHESILTEKPEGLLGAAVVLDQSEVGEFVRRVKAEQPSERRVQEFIQAWYPLDRMRCWFDTQEAKIRMNVLERLRNRKMGWKERVWNVAKRRKQKRLAETEEAGVPLTGVEEDRHT